MINQFQGEYRFLSNFYSSQFTCRFALIPRKDYVFPSVEHFYQASKATTDEDFDRVMRCATAQTKKMGRSIRLIPSWEANKDTVMLEGVWAKFSQNPYLQQRLLATADRDLIEGNYWNDKYWGVCLKTGLGQNKLGQILMHVRRVLADHFNSIGRYYGY
jgi:ribA/ribD-fused uncharacterized protein